MASVIYTLAVPKEIDHNELCIELGHPCSIEFDQDTGLALRVIVSNQYETYPNGIHTKVGKVAVPANTPWGLLKAKVDSHEKPLVSRPYNPIRGVPE